MFYKSSQSHDVIQDGKTISHETVERVECWYKVPPEGEKPLTVHVNLDLYAPWAIIWGGVSINTNCY